MDVNDRERVKRALEGDKQAYGALIDADSRVRRSCLIHAQVMRRCLPASHGIATGSLSS